MDLLSIRKIKNKAIKQITLALLTILLLFVSQSMIYGNGWYSCTDIDPSTSYCTGPKTRAAFL